MRSPAEAEGRQATAEEQTAIENAAQAVAAESEDANTPQEVDEVLVEGRAAVENEAHVLRHAVETADRAGAKKGPTSDAGPPPEDVLRLDPEPEDDTEKKQPPPEDEDRPPVERPAPKLAATPEEPDPATLDQVERIRALAAIDGGQDARRLADSAERMSAHEADDAIAELMRRIEECGDEAKLSELRALDAAAIAPDDAPTQDAKTAAPDTDADRLVALTVPLLAEDKAYQNAIANSDEQNARIEHDVALKSAVVGLIAGHIDLYKRYADEPAFAKAVASETFAKSYRPPRHGGNTRSRPRR